MREHEVPTHVQAEDRVLLGFTFPQIVAVVAVCAISYGAHTATPPSARPRCAWGLPSSSGWSASSWSWGR